MASPTTIINSSSQFNQLLSSSKYVLVDFHATWCGPCKMISPIYEKLSTQHASASNITFTKIDVDDQQQIAQQYGISAMPTFLLFKDGKVLETIRGVNPAALTAAVQKASAEVKKDLATKKAQESKKAEELKQESNDVSVSGNYGISKGSDWKMSLH